MSTILITAPDIPYPPFHGGRAASWEHAKGLRALGHTVDLIATVKSDVPEADMAAMRSIYRNIWIVRRSASPVDAIGPESYQVATRRRLQTIQLDQIYDILLLEGPYVAEIIKNKSISAASIYFRVHNDEAVYFRNLSKSSRNWLVKLFYWIESFRISATQDNCLKRADKALFISRDEMAGGMGQRTRHPLLVGHGVAENAPIVRPLTSQTVAFIGSLFMRNNQAAVDWYLQHVHPLLVARAGYRFLIAGRADPKLALALQARWSRPGVEIVISPETLDAIYDQTRVFANPSQDAAGVKVKTIEAMRNGVPVVSTVQGAAGIDMLDGRELFVAISAAGFAEKVALLLDDRDECERLVANGRDFVAREADMARNLENAYGREHAG